MVLKMTIEEGLIIRGELDLKTETQPKRLEDCLEEHRTFRHLDKFQSIEVSYNGNSGRLFYRGSNNFLSGTAPAASL